MTVINGWPGKPGVPMHPEKDGWHWISLLGSGHPQIMEWFSDAMVWADGWTVEACAKHLRYLGPVLLPDEAAAMQKRCEEAERERDALRSDASKQVATDELVRRLQHLGDWQAADRIEALQKRVAVLEGALDFYACVDHYQTHNAAAPNVVQTDRGAKARAALEKKKVSPTMTEAELRKMMRDPRYWRQRDPEWVKRVTEGFRALVGGKKDE